MTQEERKVAALRLVIEFTDSVLSKSQPVRHHEITPQQATNKVLQDAERLATAITALFRPEWKAYPEKKPIEPGEYQLTVELLVGLRVVRNDTWILNDGVGKWRTYDWSSEYGKVIAFTDPIEPYNPKQP